jgi:2-hydroxychromene-2-carboxylate isomerase
MTTRATPQARLYFNLRSPYSWLALHDLTAGYPGLAEVIDWRPCWEPDHDSERMLKAAGGRFPYTPMSREKHLYILGDVRRLAAERGLLIRWPVDRSPRWEVSHLAYPLAVRSGLGREFALAVSRARWERGLNISDPAIVAAVGADLGLDPAQIANAAEDPVLASAGTQMLLAACRDGVFGVPFFIHRWEKFWGVDRLAALAGSVRAARAAPQEGRASAPIAETVAVAASDDGHAGGCG